MMQLVKKEWRLQSINLMEFIDWYEEVTLPERRLLEQKVQIQYVKLKLEEEKIVLENNNEKEVIKQNQQKLKHESESKVSKSYVTCTQRKCAATSER